MRDKWYILIHIHTCMGGKHKYMQANIHALIAVHPFIKALLWENTIKEINHLHKKKVILETQNAT